MRLISFTSPLAVASALVAGCIDTTSSSTQSESAAAQQLSGALFTTTADGGRVNANIYAAKADVYLDGGPGNNAPSSAAAFPAGEYYFQVTDPSGHTLLSQDALECRRVRINASGVIEAYTGAAGCFHVTGTDSDHAALGAITVQLMPYADTPNNGGEYKAWLTPVSEIGANGKFLHNRSKTDNFKVRPSDETPPPPPDDTCGVGDNPACCGNGVMDAGETCDDGNTAGGDGCSAACQTEPPPPPPHEGCCGDGVMDDGETCDDGNTTSGDGCSDTCQVEPPPPPPPSDCDAAPQALYRAQ
jgi:cysteine-rich repeat protein